MTEKGEEVFCLLGYRSNVQSGESQMTFRRKMPLPYSGLKKKPSKKLVADTALINVC
jgi:hypothetical protein